MPRIIYFGEEHLVKIRVPGDTAFSDWYGKPIYGGVFGYGEWAMTAMQYPFSNLIELRYFVIHTNTGFPIAANHETKRAATARAREVLKSIDKAALVSMISSFATEAAGLERRLQAQEREQYEERNAKALPEPPPVRVKGGHVYLIRCDDKYKIGKAVDVESRLRGMQLPNKPEIIAAGHFARPHDVERELHNKYKHCRENGEWFRLIDADVEAITKRIKSNLQSVA